MTTATTPKLFLIAVIGLAVLTGCGRGADEPEETKTTQPQERAELDSLALPQENPEIGITLNSIPRDLATTLNTSLWIEITDEWNPAVKYAFVGIPEGGVGPTPATVEQFEERVNASPDGRINDRGKLDTSHGSAEWIYGTYRDDDGLVEDIHLFVPHPSAEGTLVLTSVAPKGSTRLEDRLAVMQQLLSGVS